MARKYNKIKGLTSVEVEARLEEGLDNREAKAPSKTVWQIIASNLFTYFNLIFVIIAVLLILVKSYRDLTFLPIIIANALIGIVQELRAKQILDNLNVLNVPRVFTLRDGEEREIAVHELVQDDIVRLEAGNQIPADARVIEGEVTVNEALLTGEADEVQKRVGDALMSGSFIVSGRCYASLEKVGNESYVSKLTLEARAMKQGEQSEIIRSLNKIVKLAGIAIIPIGAILFCQQYFGEGYGLQASVQAMVAAVLGMIPEGLFLLASITLVISTMKLAMQQVLLHDMKSIETLARVDTLCVDKTGTITEEKMQLADIVSLVKDQKRKELRAELGRFVRAQEADNATMTTLKEALSGDGDTTIETSEAVKVVGFSSKYKYSGVRFKDKSLVLGAPEFVLTEQFDKYKDKVQKYSEEGYRVLVFGEYLGKLSGGKLTEKVEPYGLVLIANAIRENAAETFGYFYEQGVDIKVISGDNPMTVARVAKQAGIKNSERFVDCTQLKTNREVARAAREYTVFGRVTPEQKRKLIQALKVEGHTVAMTGDGVNDVLALKDADCSIAMASGSEAAVQAAQLVLLKSDFSKMPDVVREGRKVVNNLERSGSLFLVKNVFSFLMALLTVVFSIAYPLQPAQISLISMFTIGLPAFLLSQVPNTDLIRGNFIKNIMMRALPGGITDVILVVILATVGKFMHIERLEIATAATVLLAVIGMMVLYDVSKPMRLEKHLIWWFSAIGLGFSFLFLKPLFGIVAEMSWIVIGVLVGLAVLARPLLSGLEKLARSMMCRKT